MRGFRFFEEYGDAARGESTGNVIAIPTAEPSFVQPGGICFPVVCASQEARLPNSPVRPAYVNVEYLGKRCRRITELRARAIHPRLFEYLDQLA
jgi:hypothetical protein